MARQLLHRVIVNLKEWEYLSNVAHRSLQYAERNDLQPEASALEALTAKLTAPGEEIGRDQFVLSVNRVELKLLLNKAKNERKTLSEAVLPGYELKRSSDGVRRTTLHIGFLDDLISKLEARL
jgi:hypothetical protein